MWTWVNGSDPSWFAQYSYFSQPIITNLHYETNTPPAKHFRNKDELRHSLRSLFDSMRSNVRRLHLVLGDWALDKGDENEVLARLGLDKDTERDDGIEQEWRVGQVPGWLRRELVGVEVCSSYALCSGPLLVMMLMLLCGLFVGSLCFTKNNKGRWGFSSYSSSFRYFYG